MLTRKSLIAISLAVLALSVSDDGRASNRVDAAFVQHTRRLASGPVNQQRGWIHSRVVTTADPVRDSPKQRAKDVEQYNPRHIGLRDGKYVSHINLPDTYINERGFVVRTSEEKPRIKRLAKPGKQVLLSDLHTLNPSAEFTDTELRPLFDDIVCAVVEKRQQGVKLVHPSRRDFRVHHNGIRFVARYIGHPPLDAEPYGDPLRLELHNLAEIFYNIVTDASPGYFQDARTFSVELRSLMGRLYAGEFQSVEEVLKDPYFDRRSYGVI